MSIQNVQTAVEIPKLQTEKRKWNFYVSAFDEGLCLIPKVLLSISLFPRLPLAPMVIYKKCPAVSSSEMGLDWGSPVVQTPLHIYHPRTYNFMLAAN